MKWIDLLLMRSLAFLAFLGRKGVPPDGLTLLTASRFRTATLALQKPALMRVPQLNPFPEEHNPLDTWAPFPMQTEPVQAHTNCVANSLFSLQVIVRDISNYFFGDVKLPDPDVGKSIQFLYGRLEEWHDQLPTCVDPDHITTPGIMDMQYV